MGSGVAARYANAVFELASEDQALDAVERDLAELNDLLMSSPELSRLMKSPVHSRREQVRAWSALLERLGAHPLTRKFIGVVAQKRRLYALRDITRQFKALMARRRGEMTAKVVSASSLDAVERERLVQELKAVFKRDIVLDLSIDTRLLAGLVVKVGSRMIDASLATKLDRLRLAMKEA
jgi:F-type H+-transporting ATPase subunit delta